MKRHTANVAWRHHRRDHDHRRGAHSDLATCAPTAHRGRAPPAARGAYLVAVEVVHALQRRDGLAHVAARDREDLVERLVAARRALRGRDVAQAREHRVAAQRLRRTHMRGARGGEGRSDDEWRVGPMRRPAHSYTKRRTRRRGHRAGARARTRAMRGRRDESRRGEGRRRSDAPATNRVEEKGGGGATPPERRRHAP